MKKSIREATVNDIPVIQSIAQATFPETYKNIITKEQCDYMMDMMYSTESLRRQMTQENHTYLICTVAGGGCAMSCQAVGYVSVQPIGEDSFELQKIYVLPEYQQHHIGRFLFESAVEWIRLHHPTPCHMELHVNRYNRALHFYEHMGMHKLRQGDYPIGNGYFMNDYIMGMDL